MQFDGSGSSGVSESLKPGCHAPEKEYAKLYDAEPRPNLPPNAIVKSINFRQEISPV